MGFPRKFRCFGRAKIKAIAIAKIMVRGLVLIFARPKHYNLGGSLTKRLPSYADYGDYFEITELLFRRTFYR